MDEKLALFSCVHQKHREKSCPKLLDELENNLVQDCKKVLPAFCNLIH